MWSHNFFFPFTYYNHCNYNQNAQLHVVDKYYALQRQTVVTVYFFCHQLLLFAFALQCCGITRTLNKTDNNFFTGFLMRREGNGMDTAGEVNRALEYDASS